MKLKDCELDIKAVITGPLIKGVPSESWKKSRKNGSIPESLYRFYLIANHFSFEKCPKFLKDNKNILFAHVEAATELIRDSFSEYEEIIGYLKECDSKCYNPIKHREKPKTQDQINAEKNFRRDFQQLVISMYSILDSMAETIASILSWGKVGEVHFSQLVSESNEKLNVSTGIINLNDSSIEKIKTIIREEILEVSGSSKDWYRLFKLYRNKLAHFKLSGIFMFPDKNSDFHRFLPRVWPNYIQQHVKCKIEEDIGEEERDLIFKLPMEEDVFDFLSGAREKLYDLTERIFAVIVEAYKLKKDTECNIDPRIEDQAKKMLTIYDFKHF
ncbi:MAG: hypothetical protein HQ596_01315 [Candidatus Saganbacteria bacterium]|nr:hypothetical protein [Candidatus Saganbacteria bacterium]